MHPVPDGNLTFSFRQVAFDAERAAVADGGKPIEEAREIDLALAYRLLRAEVAAVFRIEAILGVDAPDMRPEKRQGIDRVALAIEEEVGWIEVDADIVHGDVLDGA